MEDGVPVAQISELTYFMNPDGSAIPKTPTPTRIRFMDDLTGSLDDSSFSIYTVKCRCGSKQLSTGQLIGHYQSQTKGKVLL